MSVESDEVPKPVRVDGGEHPFDALSERLNNIPTMIGLNQRFLIDLRTDDMEEYQESHGGGWEVGDSSRNCYDEDGYLFRWYVAMVDLDKSIPLISHGDPMNSACLRDDSCHTPYSGRSRRKERN